MKNSVSGWIVFLLFNFLFVACDSISFELPQGPKGDDGKSAYQIWKDEVEAGHVDWPKDQTKVEDFLVYIKGVKGDKGDDGESAYDLWKEMIASGKVPDPHNPSVMWPSDKNSEVNFWEFLAGRDGNTPYIGDNNHWFIGGKDTGVPAKGLDGASAYESWKDLVAEGTIDWPKDHISMEHFFIYLKGKDGKDGANGIDGLNGKDGDTPYIKDGNWWIGGKDTGVAAKGDKGDTGETGGNGAAGVAGQSAYDLWLEELKKGTISWEGDKTPEGFLKYLKGDKGDKGDDGNDGKSAYELWKEMVEEGTISWNGGTEEVDFYQYLTGKDGESAYELWVKQLQSDHKPIDHKTGKEWDPNRDSWGDFWEYLRGADGENGGIKLVLGVYNVLIHTSQNSLDGGRTQEYIDPITGGVTYQVYNPEGILVPSGVKVKLFEGKEFTTNEAGGFTVPNEVLPLVDYGPGYSFSVEVIDGDKTHKSAPNTIVPHKMFVRLILDPEQYANIKLNEAHDLYFVLQRKSGTDGTWTEVPKDLDGVAFLEYAPYRATVNAGTVTINTPEEQLDGNGNWTNKAKFQLYTFRYTIENELGIAIHHNHKTWKEGDGDWYFTIKLNGVIENHVNKSNGKFYGQEVQWLGACKMAPWPIAPLVKTMTVYHQSSGEPHIFEKLTGEFEYKDYHRYVYKGSLKKTATLENAHYELVEPELESDDNRKVYPHGFIDFRFEKEGQTTQNICTTIATKDKPAFSAVYVYLDSQVWIKSSQSNSNHDALYFSETRTGTLIENVNSMSNSDKYIFEYVNGDKKYSVEVAYEENVPTNNN